MNKKAIIAQAWQGRKGKSIGNFEFTANPNASVPEWILELSGLNEIDRGVLLGEIRMQIQTYLASVDLEQGVNTVLLSHCPDLVSRGHVPHYQPHELAMNAQHSEQRAKQAMAQSASLWAVKAESRQVPKMYADTAVLQRKSELVVFESAWAAYLSDVAAAEMVVAARSAAEEQSKHIAAKELEKKVASAASATRRASKAAAAVVAAAAAATRAKADADAVSSARHADLLDRYERKQRSVLYWTEMADAWNDDCSLEAILELCC